MKILYFSNTRIPTEKAHGHQVVKMCGEFSLAGVTVELCLPNRQNSIKQSVFGYYHLVENFKIKKISAIDPVFLFGRWEKWYIKIQSIFFIVSLFFYLFFKKNKDSYVFYTRDEYLLPLLQLFSSNVVWEGHALAQHLKFYKKYFQNCSAIIVLTKKIKEELVDLGVEETKILVVPDAVDLDIFDIRLDKRTARDKLNLSQGKIILGYTGSFKTKNYDKGIKDILAALQILVVEEKNILFLAIGGNAVDIKEYRKMAQDLDLGDFCDFRDKVSQNDLAVYQKAFDVLLMPFPNIIHYAFYMSPLKMFEYMASQRPIVSSDLATIREVLNENNCLFCRPDDPVDLATKIKMILQDQVLAKNISQQAYQDVKLYTWKKRTENIINFINKK